MIASVITHIPRWFGWAFPWLRPALNERSTHTHVRDIDRDRISGEERRAALEILGPMSREWTLASACDAVAASSLYVPSGVYTLRHAIRWENPYTAVLDGTAPPSVAIVSRYETIYVTALGSLASEISRRERDQYACDEVAKCDRRAAYQAAVILLRPELPGDESEYGELTEQVLRYAETGAAIDPSWVSQTTSPASALIDEAYRRPRVRLLHYLTRAAVSRFVGSELTAALREREAIQQDEIRRKTLFGVPPVMKRNDDGTYSPIESDENERR